MSQLAPLRLTRFAWWIYNPKGGPNGMKSYEQYLLFCGHRIFLPPQRKVIWKHRCKECFNTIDSSAKEK